MFQRDKEGELSFEIVRTMGKLIVELKYSVTIDYMRCLEYIKLTVHQDQSKGIHKKTKAEKRKRKKYDEDDVESGLLEADTTQAHTTTALMSKKYQAESLQEISLLYFR